MQTMNAQAQQGQQQPAPGAGQQLAQPLNEQQLRQFEIMHKQAMRFLLKDTNAEMVVQQAQQGNPQEVVASMVSNLLEQLYAAAERAGQQVDMVTMLVVGIQIIGDVTELLTEAGAVQKGTEPQFIAEVSRIAVDRHNEKVQAMGGEQAAQQPGAPA